MMSVLLVAVGVGILTAGADVLVRGASGLGYRAGLSPLVVGLTVVAFGTSFPEAAVSVGSALEGRGGLALGNVVGSNVFNVLVVLGASAMVAPLVVQRQLVRLDLPVMVASSFLAAFLLWDRSLTRGEGALLFGLSMLYTGMLVRLGRAAGSESEEDDGPAPGGRRPLWQLLGFVAVGVVLLVLGARLLVSGASTIALGLGVSDLVVGLTVVAAGTSLPEAATSIVAAWRGERDMAVGNVVGSNTFNALFVLGAGGLAAPEAIPVSTGILTFDVPVMLAVSLICLPTFLTGWAISRREGLVFILYYGAYLAYLVAHSADHPAEEIIRTGLVWYALPLTVVTLGLMLWRQWGPGGEKRRGTAP